MPETDLRLRDKRTIDRALRSGLVDDKVWEKHLKALPDVAEKAEPVRTIYELMDEDDVEGDDDDDAGDDGADDRGSAVSAAVPPTDAGPTSPG